MYCGGFPPNTISDNLIKTHFGQFGSIHDVRVFKDKGYAFIKFISKEAAARAIEGTHNSEVQGHPVKCYWGKENGGEMTHNGINAAAIAASGMVGIGINSIGGNPMQASQNAMQNAVAAAAAAQQHGANQQLSAQAAAAAAANSAQYPYSAAYGHMGYWYPVSFVGFVLVSDCDLMIFFCCCYRVATRRCRHSTCNKATRPTRTRTPLPVHNSRPAVVS